LGWIARLLSRVGLTGVLAQIRTQPKNSVLSDIAKTLSLCGPRAARPETDLLFEFLARVPSVNRDLQERLKAEADSRTTFWARPVDVGFGAGLAKTTEPLITTMPVTPKVITGINFCGSAILVVASYDGILRLLHSDTLDKFGELDLKTGRIFGLAVSNDGGEIHWCSDRGLGKAILQSSSESGALPQLVEVWRGALTGEDESSLLAVLPLKVRGVDWLVSVDRAGCLQWRAPETGKICFEHATREALGWRSMFAKSATLATLVHLPGRDGFVVSLDEGGGVHLFVAGDDPLARTLGEPGLALKSNDAQFVDLVHRVVTENVLLPEDVKSVGAAAVSPDGKVLFHALRVNVQSGTGKTIVEAVNLDGTGTRRRMSLETYTIRCLYALSADIVLAGHAIGVIDAVNVTNRTHLGRYTVSDGCFCICADGTTVATGHDDGSVRLWAKDELVQLYGIETWHRGPIIDLKMAQARSIWFAKGRTQRFLLSRTDAERWLTLRATAVWLRYAFWPSKVLVSFCTGGELTRWDLKTHSQIFANTLETSLLLHTTHFYRTGRLSANGKYFAGPTLRQVRRHGYKHRNGLWIDLIKTADLRNKDLVFTGLLSPSAPSEDTCPIAVGPSGRIVVAKPSENLLLWHPRRRYFWPQRFLALLRGGRDAFSIKLTKKSLKQRPCQMEFSHDGRWLCLLFELDSVALLRTSDFHRVKSKLQGTPRRDLYQDFQVQPRYELSGANDGPMPRDLTCFTMDRNARRIWVGTTDGHVCCWDRQTQRVKLSGTPCGFSIARIGLIGRNKILLISGGQRIEFLDSASLVRRAVMHVDCHVTAIMAIDHERFAVGFQDGRVCFFALQNLTGGDQQP
jgi:WD40 repeat protein